MIYEKDVKEFLVKKLEKTNNWECFIHEGKWHRIFTISESCGWPDIYAITKIKEFPIVVIETKVGRSLGELISGLIQIKKYVSDLKRAKYFVNKSRVHDPVLVLFASKDSITQDIFYVWKAPQFGKDFMAASKGLSDEIERIFWKVGAAILKSDGFMYRNKNYRLKKVARLEDYM